MAWKAWLSGFGDLDAAKENGFSDHFSERAEKAEGCVEKGHICVGDSRGNVAFDEISL